MAEEIHLHKAALESLDKIIMGHRCCNNFGSINPCNDHWLDELVLLHCWISEK